MQVRVDCSPGQLLLALKAIHLKAARIRSLQQFSHYSIEQRAMWDELQTAEVYCTCCFLFTIPASWESSSYQCTAVLSHHQSQLHCNERGNTCATALKKHLVTLYPTECNISCSSADSCCSTYAPKWSCMPWRPARCSAHNGQFSDTHILMVLIL